MEVSVQQRQQLQAAYDAAYPRECCGFLLGSKIGKRWIVRRVISTLNAVSTVGGFAIPDHELRRVFHLAQDFNLSIVALFHSHPSGSKELSDTDRNTLSHSQWPWVILTKSGTGEMQLTWPDFAARAALQRRLHEMQPK